MKKVLFLIHDLGQGGAERVLVNLVNRLDREKFDISVTALFGGGVNEPLLAPDIRYQAVFSRTVRGNSHLMKLFSPSQLHRLCVREHYDIEVSYLEGPSARVVSGCTDDATKLVSWIHIEQKARSRAAASFRSDREALRCYRCFDRTVCVSDAVRQDFLRLFPLEHPVDVLYNTNASEQIVHQAGEPVEEALFSPDELKLVGVGKLVKSKGFDRLLQIVKRLRSDGFPVHLYLLGEGPMRRELERFAAENALQNAVTLLGYQANPYRYIARCDLFVCASLAEGFSTAATEALIVGTPVCTVDVSGMKELLGAHDEWGIVTPNNDDALCAGIRELLSDPEMLARYRSKAAERGKTFSAEYTTHTVKAVEEMLLSL